jgi:hypothetical protein
MIKLKNLITEKKQKSTPIEWNERTYYIDSDYMGKNKVFAFDDSKLNKVAKHPNGGTLIFKVSDINYSLQK